ncbi:hypothetical protein SUGI_0889550 [Cryptomeria japonica]|nr:hypothetical protein SUGI_0889550 [Cryptomeria japonica]
MDFTSWSRYATGQCQQTVKQWEKRLVCNEREQAGTILPPCLVVIGGMDILHDRQLLYMEHLKKMKKEAELLFYETACHGFFVMPYPLSSQFLDDISNFMYRL